MLRLESVSKRYGGRTILRNISLRLEAGQSLLLAGDNGVGKSTLLRLVAGLTRPSGGQIHLEENCRLAYLGHAAGFYPHLSALDNLRFWQRLHQAPAGQEGLLAALGRVGLAARAKDRVGSFSRGMAQRLNLARIVLQQPDLLLLDEPGTGLDREGINLLATEIMAAKKRGAAILWVSHDLGRDLPLADRLLKLAPGRGGARVVFDGSPDAGAPEEAISEQASREGAAC